MVGHCLKLLILSAGKESGSGGYRSFDTRVKEGDSYLWVPFGVGRAFSVGRRTHSLGLGLQSCGPLKRGSTLTAPEILQSTILG
jgi:hypothetical protein